jgi:hypothetical protein
MEKYMLNVAGIKPKIFFMEGQRLIPYHQLGYHSTNINQKISISKRWDWTQLSEHCYIGCIHAVDSAQHDYTVILSFSYAIKFYPKILLHNFLQSVIPTWQVNKLVR